MASPANKKAKTEAMDVDVSNGHTNGHSKMANGKGREMYMAPEGESILPQTDVPPCQFQASRATTMVDYMSNLEITSRAHRVRLSGIVCTIGPVSRAPETLLEMMENGMNVARMNFSHGTHEYHKQTIANCRTAETMYKEKHGIDPCLAIALDTKGPEIRTGLLEGDDGRKELELKAGNTIKIVTDDAFKEKCTDQILWVDYKNIAGVLEVGKRLFIDDGLISVKATEIGDNYVIGLIENGGNLGSRKGCNLPATDTDLPAVSEKDKQDLLFGVEQDVDYVFASFIRNASGVQEVKNVLGEAGKQIWVIPKIENQEGVKNIDEIIEASEGIMVARGDMGIEIPTEKVFIAQKQMIAKCNKAGKPIIVATMMLESMVKKPRPTRAEASDVANAIMDGADCVMLSGETAKGDFPVAAVRTMAAISREAESCFWNENAFMDMLKSERHTMSGAYDITSTSAVSAVLASYKIQAAAIVILTTSGKSALELSKYKPMCPIITITRFPRVARQLQMCQGVIPLLYKQERDSEWMKDVENRIAFATDFGKQRKFIKSGDPVVCVTGWRTGTGSTNTIRILTVE